MDNYSIPKQLFPFYDYLKLNTYKNLNFYRCIRFTSLSLFLFNFLVNFPFYVKIHKRIYKRIASDKMKISPEIHRKGYRKNRYWEILRKVILFNSHDSIFIVKIILIFKFIRLIILKTLFSPYILDKFLPKYLRGFLHFPSSREAEVWLLKDTKFACRLTASE